MKVHSATNQTFILWGVCALFLFGSFYIGSSIGESSEVPFAVMSNVITCVLALIALVSPRRGLFIVVFQAMFTDEFKRIAVAYSAVSMDLVITILIGPLITICAIHLSIFMKAVIFRTMKVEASYWYFQSAIAFLTIGMIIFGEGNMSSRGQFAANLGLYLSLLPLIPLLLPTLKVWRGFMALQIILVLPSAIWGIKQYMYGFTKIEWDYALTGLSMAHYVSMITGGDKPRIFGLLGSASAFGCMSLYATYAIWQSIMGKAHRFFFLISGIILMIAVILATQRTMLLTPIIILACYLLMLTPRRTGAFYVLIIILLVTGVLSAQYMLDKGIDEVNALIHTDSEWGEKVFSVNTFSDRLKGWTQFTDASTWSLFGTGASSKEEYEEKGGHDLINKMLIRVGVAGLLPIIILISIVLTFLHRIVWRSPTLALRREGAFLLACFVPQLVMNIMGGGNLNTVPINLQIWSMLAGVLIFRKQYDIDVWSSKKRFQRNQIMSRSNIGNDVISKSAAFAS